MKFHPLCELFPLMPAKELKALAEDIIRHGLREPILVYDGQIIDGRNRIRACELAGVEPEFKKFDGDPKGLVASLNLRRRHLNAGQRAMLAVKILEYVYEQRGGIRPSVLDTAKAGETSARTAKSARRVNRNGSADLKNAVLKGEADVDKAAAVAGLPKQKQMAALKEPPKPKPESPETDSEEAAERDTVKSIAIDLVEKVREEMSGAYTSFDSRTVKAFAKILIEKMEEIL